MGEGGSWDIIYLLTAEAGAINAPSIRCPFGDCGAARMLSFLRQKLPLLVTGATTAPLLCRVWTGEHHIEADSIRRPQKVLGRKRLKGRERWGNQLKPRTHFCCCCCIWNEFPVSSAMGIRFSCTVALLREGYLGRAVSYWSGIEGGARG